MPALAPTRRTFVTQTQRMRYVSEARYRANPHKVYKSFSTPFGVNGGAVG
jgi:hypothetical protein